MPDERPNARSQGTQSTRCAARDPDAPRPTPPKRQPVPDQPSLPLPLDATLMRQGAFIGLRLYGPEADLVPLIERLTRELPVVLFVDAFTPLPDAVWEAFPPNFLSASERALVREDLCLYSTAEIARRLHFTRNTISTYRRRIREQFSSIAPEQRPGWMHAWLRRYPGLKGDQP